MKRITEKVELNAVLVFISAIMGVYFIFIGTVWVLSYSDLIDASLNKFGCLLLNYPVITFSLVGLGCLLMLVRVLSFREV